MQNYLNTVNTQVGESLVVINATPSINWLVKTCPFNHSLGYEIYLDERKIGVVSYKTTHLIWERTQIGIRLTAIFQDSSEEIWWIK